MTEINNLKNDIFTNGYTIIENIYTSSEVTRILQTIAKADSSNNTFRKSSELFAVRQFLKEIPESAELIFNAKFKSVVKTIFGEDYFAVKSIYFDKPKTSNWYVSYHQDLTISVDKKINLEGFGLWTLKQNQYSVQPPLDILKNIFTIRIHLDDTDENNGALRVIPGTHVKEICRPENIALTTEEVCCPVPKGGIMIMKPLLFHSSDRTTNSKQRRVIHIEFSNMELPDGIKWAERFL